MACHGFEEYWLIVFGRGPLRWGLLLLIPAARAPLSFTCPAALASATGALFAISPGEIISDYRGAVSVSVSALVSVSASQRLLHATI